MPATESYLRNIKSVHVVFSLSAIALFAVTIWMMAADYEREWPAYQRKFDDIQTKKQIAAISDIEQSPQYKTSHAEIEKQLAAAEKTLDEHSQHVKQLSAKLKEAEREFDLVSRAIRNARAYRDKARADYDIAIRDAKPQATLDRLISEFDVAQNKVNDLEKDGQEKELARNKIQDKLKVFTKKRDDAIAALAKLNGDIDLRTKALEKLDPGMFSDLSAFKKTIMEWPIINGFNSPLKITQDWLPNLTIQLGMARTARFDRCRTCHVAIEKVEAGNVQSFPFGHPDVASTAEWVFQNKYPHPYATHPRPELYLTSASPHPLQKYGCTICHDGQGSGTSFKDASHTANNPYIYSVWHQTHHYESNHFWEYPMQPERLRESTCLKCHHSVVELGVHPKFGASAPKVFKGYNLVKEYGCFGCHEIQGFDGMRPIGPDLRLEPSTAAEAARIAADPTQIAGTMRKVGPSLRHIASKSTPQFVNYWVEEPKRFRPTTRMPQFFHLTNQQDKEAQQLQPVEIAGIARFLFTKSEPLDRLSPEKDYVPDAARGKDAFSKRGCLACHSHQAFPNSHATFGPELSKEHAKIKPGEDGFLWTYTWIRDPERYHKRTKMPNLFIEPYEEGGKKIDPAADIAAFLLEGGPEKFPDPEVNRKDLDRLVLSHLSRAIKLEEAEAVMRDRKYPLDETLVRGDEVELISHSPHVSDQEWFRMKLNYVGRKTISRYGCYGCHDIPAYENARPIGTALQDWGRKDTSRLAPEHIDEYLEQDKTKEWPSSHERVIEAMKNAEAGGTATGQFKGNEEEREMRFAYFYNDLIHHGRGGFLWQKLRDPRSYDYKKIATKGYEERLRMPRFSFTEEENEAISTFILGLVADPPANSYLYHPDGPAKARIEGERLLDRYNCVGCHMVDMPQVRFTADPASIPATELQASDHPDAIKLLLELKPPEKAKTGEMLKVKTEGGEKQLPVLQFHGLIYGRPDPADEDQEFAYDLWETLDVDGKTVLPSSRMLVKRTQLVSGASPQDGYAVPARGGAFAEWLVERLMATVRDTDRGRAWQMVPPPLYKEGIKVQTPWLYQFLREPYRLRHTTVLRMPRFNMSADEAQTLANYFAAVDDQPFPYQRVVERDPDYLAQKQAELKDYLAPHNSLYLDDAWRTLNAEVCISCHSLAGREVRIGDPKKDIRGPNLEYVADRLRPDWLLLWLYSPKWITPYTSMPQVFSRNRAPREGAIAKLFGDKPDLQAIATRDALMNYHRLMEEKGKMVVEATADKSSPPPAAEGSGSNSSTRKQSPAVRGQE